MTDPEPAPNGDDTDQAGIEQTWGALVVFCGGDEALAANIWRLMDAFREKARMTAVVRFDRRGVHTELERSWWPHLREILELSDGNVDTAVRTIEASVKKLDEWDPTAVQAPRSIVNKARAVIAAGERGAPLEGKPKANGRPKAPAVSLPGINDLSQYGRRRRPVLVDTPKGDE